jgi:hypothetical protein
MQARAASSGTSGASRRSGPPSLSHRPNRLRISGDVTSDGAAVGRRRGPVQPVPAQRSGRSGGGGGGGAGRVGPRRAARVLARRGGGATRRARGVRQRVSAGGAACGTELVWVGGWVGGWVKDSETG